MNEHDDVAGTVRVLLTVAHLAVSDEEFDEFVRIYPALRGQADGLYRTEFASEEPALLFDPRGLRG